LLSLQGHRTLTTLDSILGGYVKNVVYQVRNKEAQQLKYSIKGAVLMVTHNMLIKASGERLNLIWIFVVIRGVPLWKCAEVGSSDTRSSRIFLCNGAKQKSA
jgi:hypothetical protein